MLNYIAKSTQFWAPLTRKPQIVLLQVSQTVGRLPSRGLPAALGRKLSLLLPGLQGILIRRILSPAASPLHSPDCRLPAFSLFFPLPSLGFTGHDFTLATSPAWNLISNFPFWLSRDHLEATSPLRSPWG